MDGVIVRAYRPADEEGWVRCRVLSFLGSAYFDDVRREKERYERPSIELVAEEDGEITGLIDVEWEQAPGTVCSDRPGLGGMIWHWRCTRIASGAGSRPPCSARQSGSPPSAESCGSKRGHAMTSTSRRGTSRTGSLRSTRTCTFTSSFPKGFATCSAISEGLRPVKVFAHYTGERRDEVKRRFARVHDCVLYEHRFELQTARVGFQR
jgi:hypothetical protein